jgi:FtsH-binding integral membrane protein
MQAPGAMGGYGGQQQFNDISSTIAAEASPEARAKFIERTYLHLAGAIFVFVALSTVLQVLPGIEALVNKMIQSRASWGVVLLLFMGTSYIADRWALNSTSIGKQYAGLVLYTLAEVVIFVPLLYIARMVLGGAEPIIMAGGATLAMFAAMTAYVFITKKDFSFMRGALAVLTMGACGLVVGSLIFGFSLGIVFSVAMIALASGYILFYTSNIIKHYRVDQHVAAALALFSAVALLFWYMVRLLMQLSRN